MSLQKTLTAWKGGHFLMPANGMRIIDKLLLILLREADENGVVMSPGSFSEELGISRNSCWGHASLLCKKGLLQKVQEGGYKITDKGREKCAELEKTLINSKKTEDNGIVEDGINKAQVEISEEIVVESMELPVKKMSQRGRFKKVLVENADDDGIVKNASDLWMEVGFKRKNICSSEVSTLCHTQYLDFIEEGKYKVTDKLRQEVERKLQEMNSAEKVLVAIAGNDEGDSTTDTRVALENTTATEIGFIEIEPSSEIADETILSKTGLSDEHQEKKEPDCGVIPFPKMVSLEPELEYLYLTSKENEAFLKIDGEGKVPEGISTEERITYQQIVEKTGLEDEDELLQFISKLIECGILVDTLKDGVMGDIYKLDTDLYLYYLDHVRIILPIESLKWELEKKIKNIKAERERERVKILSIQIERSKAEEYIEVLKEKVSETENSIKTLQNALSNLQRTLVDTTISKKLLDEKISASEKEVDEFVAKNQLDKLERRLQILQTLTKNLDPQEIADLIHEICSK